MTFLIPKAKYCAYIHGQRNTYRMDIIQYVNAVRGISILEVYFLSDIRDHIINDLGLGFSEFT